MADAGEFEKWLNDRLDSLEVDQEVYGAYILGILQEEESDEEKEDALLGILSAFLEDEKLEDVCKEIISQWAESCARSATKNKEDAEVLAIANLIEKQAQIVVKQKEVSQESRKRKEAKEAVLAQYANITDDEEYPWLNILHLLCAPTVMLCPLLNLYSSKCLKCLFLKCIMKAVFPKMFIFM
ncbi:unnamed protein product [Oncorhynchus mykiss]|uniref:Coiled-coil domain-containing protein 43 n=1 Tax=Oncorhynchus mykiss TaxID=8022 RepID=A0A060X4C6_ONCMY|nr:unnamed protein product [Oncorhynchus mykiss]